MATIRCIKAFPRVLLLVLSLTLPGCQNQAAGQTTPASIVNPISPLSAGLTPIPSPGLTIELTATASNTPTLEFTPTPEFTATLAPTLTPLPPPFLDLFISSLINGDAQQVVGVFVDGILALKVVQQPASDSGYISAENGVARWDQLVFSVLLPSTPEMLAVKTFERLLLALDEPFTIESGDAISFTPLAGLAIRKPDETDVQLARRGEVALD
jgi:hypothetical protein